MLNKAGYRIIFDEDLEESGIFAVNDGKICKSKSFPFMDSLTNLYYIKTEPICLWQFGKVSGYNYGIEDSAIVQIEISEKLLLTLRDWKIYDQGHLMNIQNVRPA
jgi:hypothetical protein